MVSEVPIGSKSILALALHYGLLTQETSAVLVKVRADADKADGLPVIAPVPQMTPEGMVTFHGVASAVASAPDFSGRRVVRNSSLGAALRKERSSRSTAPQHASADNWRDDSGDCYMDIPAFSTKQASSTEPQKLANLAVAREMVSNSTSDTAFRLFLELYRVLFDALLNHEAILFSLEFAVIEMPEEMREPARRLLEQCGLKVEYRDSKVCAQLLIVLNAALKLKPFDNDQEAILSARRGGSIGAAFGRFLWRFERSRLMKSVTRAIQSG